VTLPLPAFRTLHLGKYPCEWTGIPTGVDPQGMQWHALRGATISRCYGLQGRKIQIMPAPATMRVQWKTPNQFGVKSEPVVCLALVEYCDGARDVQILVQAVSGSILDFNPESEIHDYIHFTDGEYEEPAEDQAV
jgi:hypothetical protein